MFYRTSAGVCNFFKIYRKKILGGAFNPHAYLQPASALETAPTIFVFDEFSEVFKTA